MRDDRNDLPIEKVMFFVLEASPLIPRAVKNAFVHDWDNGRPGMAMLGLALWQFTLLFFAIVVINFILKGWNI